MTPEEIVTRLELLSVFEGKKFGRVPRIHAAEVAYAQMTAEYRGYDALSDAFKCFFLETVGLVNRECKPKITEKLPDFYAYFVARLTNSFHSLCGAEGLAVRGYPLQAYALLRNIFDNHALTSAAIQGITDIYSIDGIDPATKTFDRSTAKRRRIRTERDVQANMTGRNSGLNPQDVIELERWDNLFDMETHGARLSLATYAMDWLNNAAPLPVLPEFDETTYSMFMNRYCEVAWMTHRLIPHVQPPGISLPDDWRHKWRALDEIFEQFPASLTKQLGKGIGAAIVEFVKLKFPFNENSAFPQ